METEYGCVTKKLAKILLWIGLIVGLVIMFIALTKMSKIKMENRYYSDERIERAGGRNSVGGVDLCVTQEADRCCPLR